MAGMRYIVDDVEVAVEFYRDALGFTVKMHNPGHFAALTREDLTLFVNSPGSGSAGKAGGTPEPGGWNRIQIVTRDLEALIASLEEKGVRFRGEIAEAQAGRQIRVEDPAGNPGELFEYSD